MDDKMIMRLYSIYDKAAERYGPIFEAVNDIVANRNYRLLLERVDVISKDEFSLVCLGSVNKVSGKIDAYEIPQDLPYISKFPENNDNILKSGRLKR